MSCPYALWGNLTYSPKPPDHPKIILPLSTEVAENVFEIPELLGNILSYVPAEDLLTNKQLVSRTWKSAIDSTPTVKHKLWQRLQTPSAATPFTTTKWDNNTHWPTSTSIEQSILHSGVPAYNGTFAINMLASPTHDMRETIAREAAEWAMNNPPPPPPAVCPIPIFRGLISNNFFPPPLPPATKTLVKPHDYMTTLEPTPLGPLVTIGMKFLQRLVRGRVLDDNLRTFSPAPQHAWLDMFVTDPPLQVVWLSVPVWVRGPDGRLQRVQSACSVMVPDGVRFGHVRDAVAGLTLVDANQREEISIMTYNVRVCFLAEGISVDGKVVQSATKWV